MRAEAEGFSVVVVGAWNTAIFSPDWIKNHLTRAPHIGIEFAVNAPTLPLRLAFDDIFLLVSPDRLAITPQQVRDDLLAKTQEVATLILDALPHTPVAALGINFRFREPQPAGRLLETFVLTDRGHLADAGAVVRATSIRRGLSVNDDFVNLTLELKPGGEVTAEFNFHHEVDKASSAKERLASGVLRRRDMAIELLRATYQVEEMGV